MARRKTSFEESASMNNLSYLVCVPVCGDTVLLCPSHARPENPGYHLSLGLEPSPKPQCTSAFHVDVHGMK